MRASLPSLTRAERQAATHILSHFPMSALGSITMLASAAEVSAPTVVRLVQKLGFKGYADYQAALRAEVGRLLAAPSALPGQAPRLHPMQAFAAQAIANIQMTLDQIAAPEFDAAAALLADPGRHVAIMGGRLTHAHAGYMATLLRVIRPGVTCVSDHPTGWQQALLDLRTGDVVVIFDIRRYEANAIHMAELAARQGARIVLVTDHGLSPAAGYAHHILPCRITMPAAWDSTVTILMLVEALLGRVQGHCADQVQDRLNRLEDVFAKTRIFRTPTPER
nr:MurR/RpiR family transcriptional regulator [Paracoccus shandongensis]